MNDNNNLTVGDLVTKGTYCLYDGPDKTIWLTRDGDLMYQTVQWKNVQALFDDNAEAAASFNKHGDHGALVKLASVPVGLRNQWLNEGITEDPKALALRLNDPDNAKFRVNNWRV